MVQDLPINRWLPSNRFVRALSSGWQSFGLVTLTSGLPFTVYSGIQQTGAGSIGADRPDQIGSPDLSTSRPVREDYFGLGSNNASFFSVPINVSGGTGPNQGVFGTLGRDTFRGPRFHNFDVSLLKETPLGRERVKLSVSGRVLQRFQYRELRIAREHRDGSRLWCHQSYRRNFASNPVFTQAALLTPVLR
jgi:hypothetical protein